MESRTLKYAHMLFFLNHVHKKLFLESRLLPKTNSDCITIMYLSKYFSFTHWKQVYFTWAQPVLELNGVATADISRRFLCSPILDVLTSPDTRQSRPANRYLSVLYIHQKTSKSYMQVYIAAICPIPLHITHENCTISLSLVFVCSSDQVQKDTNKW